jgi:hypothetical protein
MSESFEFRKKSETRLPDLMFLRPERNSEHLQEPGDAPTRYGCPLDVQSQSSSTGTFDSCPFSNPRELVSSMEASILLEDDAPSRFSLANSKQSRDSALAVTVKMNTQYEQNPDGSQIDIPRLNSDGNSDGNSKGWHDANVSSPIPETPIPKADGHERRHEKLRGAYRKLMQMREKNLKTRLRAHEIRNQLRGKRELAAAADASLVKVLDTLFATNTSKEARELRVLYENAKNTRDDYQPIEDTYNGLDDQVDQEEYELMMAEKRFYERQINDSEIGESTVPDDYESSHSSFVSGQPFIEYPSVVMEYVSRRGDAVLALERLQEHRQYRAGLVEKERLSNRHGLRLDDESRSFLAEFDSVHDTLQRELADIDSNLEALANVCVEQGLWGMIDYTGLDELLLPGEEAPEDDPLKLDDEHKDLQIRNMTEGGSSQDTELIDRTKFINAWLYRSLRASRGEIFKLKDEIRWCITLEPQEVTKKILEWWFKDKAAISSMIPTKSARAFSTYSTLDHPLRKAVSLRSQTELPHMIEIYSNRSV